MSSKSWGPNLPEIARRLIYFVIIVDTAFELFVRSFWILFGSFSDVLVDPFLESFFGTFLDISFSCAYFPKVLTPTNNAANDANP